MSKREKIILLLTLAAVLYWALDFMVLSRKNSGSNPGFGETSQQVKNFSAGAMAKISRIDIQAKESNWQAWTSRIESPWDQDPFLSHTRQETKKKVRQLSPGDGLIFSGYMLVGDKAFAVINGMEYKRGETIEPQGFVVKKITSAKVVLQRKSEHIVLYLKEEQI